MTSATRGGIRPAGFAPCLTIYNLKKNTVADLTGFVECYTMGSQR